jgi:membrane protein DedA with SNARE-associated domain
MTNQRMLLWVLVLFFGGTVLFGSLRRATEDSSTGVIVGVQVAALAVVVVVLVLVVQRLRK